MMDGNQFQNWFRQSIEVLHDCIEWMMQKTEAKPKKKIRKKYRPEQQSRTEQINEFIY